MPLTEWPLKLAGHIYGSPMPFGLYDREGELLREVKQRNVSVVVLLATDQECSEKADRDLRDLYKQEGLTVIDLPIQNYGVPPSDRLTAAIAETIKQAQQGQNVLIHCSAGIGRTPLFAGLVARQALGLSGRDAVEWVGQHHPGALFTPVQVLMVLDDNP